MNTITVTTAAARPAAEQAPIADTPLRDPAWRRLWRRRGVPGALAVAVLLALW